MRSSLASWCRSALLIGLCMSFAAGAQAKAADTADAPAQAGTMPASSGPWWDAFHEPVLATLERAAQAQAYDPAADPVAARGRSLRLDAEIAAAYIGMRVIHVRLMLAEEMRNTLAQQRKFLSAGAPTLQRADAMAALDARIARADRHAAELRRQREPFIALLAERCGITVEAMLTTLQPALALRDGPLFDAQAPQRLPRAVLAARPDVGAVEGRLLLGRKLLRRDDARAAAWPGWIDTAGDADAAPVLTSLPDASDLVDVAAEAEREVRTDLSDLQRRSRETALRAEVLRTRQVEVAAAQRRRELGAGSESEVIAAYQQLLIDNDLLVMAGGELSRAWIKLHTSNGGRALAAGALPQSP